MCLQNYHNVFKYLLIVITKEVIKSCSVKVALLHRRYFAVFKAEFVIKDFGNYLQRSKLASAEQ